MATFKYGTNSLLALTSRVTTPSLHIQKNGNHWYVPLFSGNKGAVVQSGEIEMSTVEYILERLPSLNWDDTSE